jgi:hypothetical protein
MIGITAERLRCNLRLCNETEGGVGMRERSWENSCRHHIFIAVFDLISPQFGLSIRWQVLYLEHSVESLAGGGPWLLGTVRRGLSTWRAMGEVDTEKYRGSSRRRLYGCVLTIFSGRAHKTVSGAGPSTAGTGSEAFEQQLLTWSQASPRVVNMLLMQFREHMEKRLASCRLCCFTLGAAMS